MTVFQHETTKQVIQLDETQPGVFEVLGSPTPIAILLASGWKPCPQDPDYRGMPKASAPTKDTLALTKRPQ